MKLDAITKLLRAINARKQLEQNRLASICKTQSNLLAEADALEKAAFAPLDGDNITGLTLRLYDRKQHQLRTTADARRGAACALEPHKMTQQEKLRAQIRQEFAWRSLWDEAQHQRRKEIEARDEERRETFIHIKHLEN